MAMKQSYYIDAPVATVFDYLKDPTKSNDLVSFDMEMRELKMTEEGTGTYTSWRTKIAGIPVEGFDVVTDFVPNKHITEKSSNAMVGTWDYTFEPEGSGTKLTMEHHSRSVWALPPLRNLVDFTTTRISRSTFIPRLKARLEPVPRPR